MKHKCKFINGVANDKVIPVEDTILEYCFPIESSLSIVFRKEDFAEDTPTHKVIAHYKRMIHSNTFILDYVS